jgi:hypothetical protein
MFNTTESAAAKVRELKLPAIFDRIWKSHEPRRFCRLWRRPTIFFDVWHELISQCPRIGTCVPLLESNGDQIVAFDTEQHVFVEYYFGDDECSSIGKTYQQFISSLFVDFGYAGLMDLVEEVAAEFEYEHLDSLVKFMEVDDDSSAEDAKQAFVDSIEN